MKRSSRRLQILIGVVAVVLWMLRDQLIGLALIGMQLLLLLIPIVVVFGGLGYALYRAWRQSNATSIIPQMPSQPLPVTHSLADQLSQSFRRSNQQQLDLLLQGLPSWPISQQIRQTANDLLVLKRAIYRAQSEGVPLSIIERYLQNMDRAAAVVWELASKIDSVGSQQVSYQLVEARLIQEGQQLTQLQQAIKDAHEGIALFILAGMRSDQLQDVEADLRALSQAMKQLESMALVP